MSGDLVHRLGAVVGTVFALAWSVGWWGRARRERRARRRLAEVLALERTVTASRLTLLRTARSWLPYAGVAGAGWVLVGGPAGAVAGLGGLSTVTAPPGSTIIGPLVITISPYSSPEVTTRKSPWSWPGTMIRCSAIVAGCCSFVWGSSISPCFTT